MDRDIIDNIKYIKNISKKKLQLRKYLRTSKKKYPNINQEDIKKIIDDMVKDNVLRENGIGKKYDIHHTRRSRRFCSRDARC